jgi:6-phosphogluconolactonase
VNRELWVFESREALASAAVERFVEAARQSIAGNGRFAVALSGGETPRRLLELLAQPPNRAAVDWPKVFVFFVDERFVPAGDPASNLGLVRDCLLAHVPVPAENVYAMPTQGGKPDACAEGYAHTLRNFFGALAPRFDLVVLGMGADGHTASLFPRHRDRPGITAAVYDAPKPPPVRLTLTLPAINAAAMRLFLVAGAEKAEAVRTIFESGNAKSLPAGKVVTSTGKTLWLADRDAASLLSRYNLQPVGHPPN